jgi:membrane protein required for colicin V production
VEERVNQIDALLLVFLIPFAVRGWGRGFCRESLGLGGLVGGVLLAAAAGPPLAFTLSSHGLLSALLAPFAAPVALFLAAVVVAHLLGALAARLARALLLGGVDRTAGLLFGALKAATLVGFALLLVQRVVPSTTLTQLVAGSRLASPLTRLAAGIVDVGRGLGPRPHGQSV